MNLRVGRVVPDEPSRPCTASFGSAGRFALPSLDDGPNTARHAIRHASLGVRRHLASGGFSLVEVMCAILILGIGLAGLTHGITTSLSSSKEAELQTVAALIAAGKIETLRAEGYVVDGETEGECGEGLALYRWKQTVSSTAIDGLHEVEVVVENSKTGKSIYELRTMLFDPPSYSSLNDTSKRKDRPESRRRERRKR